MTMKNCNKRNQTKLLEEVTFGWWPEQLRRIFQKANEGDRDATRFGEIEK